MTLKELIDDRACSASLIAAQVLAIEMRAMENLSACLGEAFDDIVRCILECRGHVVVTGLGKSGIIGQKISATLSSTGTTSYFLHAAEALHGDLGRVRPDDLVIALSSGGKTEEVLTLVETLRREGRLVIGITCRAGSPLARLADRTLVLGDIREACPLGMAPTASTTAMLVIGDAIAVAVSGKRGFTSQQFNRSHPGGTLGKLSAPVSSLLRFRVGHNLALAAEDQLLADVLRAADRIKRRCGAIVVTRGRNHELVGLLTDGDLRRQLVERGGDLLNLPIGKVMSMHPKSINRQAEVGEAVERMRSCRIDELPVVDDRGGVVGLLDIQDLFAMKVLDEQ